MLFCFASLPLFLQFKVIFVHVLRVLWDAICMSKLPTVYPRITLRIGFISWINFLYSWQVAGTRDPPKNLARVRNTRNRHWDLRSECATFTVCLSLNYSVQCCFQHRKTNRNQWTIVWRRKGSMRANLIGVQRVYFYSLSMKVKWKGPECGDRGLYSQWAICSLIYEETHVSDSICWIKSHLAQW